MAEGTSRQPLIVAIDGPAGAGKSTVARALAQRFGLLNLESGAMYRAFALKALRTGVATNDAAALESLAHTTQVRLESGSEGNRVLLDSADVTDQLRTPKITAAASEVSIHPPIRRWLVSLQQALGAQGNVVMEGRDIGTVVFPHADVKIFLDAAPEVRGLRRYDQMGQIESTSEIQPEAVVQEMRARDQRDRNRADSPLKPATDAVLLDSTHLTLDQVVTQAEAIVIEKLRAAVLTPAQPR